MIDKIKLAGVDTKDYPKFCDAYIVSAERNGKALTEAELEKINEDKEFVNEKVLENLNK